MPLHIHFANYRGSSVIGYSAQAALDVAEADLLHLIPWALPVSLDLIAYIK